MALCCCLWLAVTMSFWWGALWGMWVPVTLPIREVLSFPATGPTASVRLASRKARLFLLLHQSYFALRCESEFFSAHYKRAVQDRKYRDVFACKRPIFVRVWSKPTNQLGQMPLSGSD